MSHTELLPKSKTQAVRLLEVFTGAGRRRAWPPSKRTELLRKAIPVGNRFPWWCGARIDAAAIIRVATECAASGWG
jgi:hypothetical protein